MVFSKYVLRNAEDYNYFLQALQGLRPSAEEARSAYYVRTKFEILEVGGLKKIIQVSSLYFITVVFKVEDYKGEINQ